MASWFLPDGILNQTDHWFHEVQYCLYPSLVEANSDLQLEFVTWKSQIHRSGYSAIDFYF